MLAFHYWQHYGLKLEKFERKVNRLNARVLLWSLILHFSKFIYMVLLQKGVFCAMKEEWIKAFGKLTYGIYVLTSHHEEKINGMIASWVSQVSFDPPLIMVAVHPNRFSHQLIEHGGSFALHVLAGSQANFLSRFKGADLNAKFSTLNWTYGKTGCPILSECLAYLECELKTHYRPGNHTLFIGEVIAAGVSAHQKPFTTTDYDGIYLGKA
jgi:flavin reductase (DIM6/NTAB) family NADH-FMN oxidoreductase RutF